MASPHKRPRPTPGHGSPPPQPETPSPKPVGRPQGAPSTIINLRLPLDLLHQLDRYLDHLETSTGLKANRGMVARRALALFLESHAPRDNVSPSQPALRKADGAGPATSF